MKHTRSCSEAIAHRRNPRSSSDLSAVALAKAEAVAHRKNPRSSSDLSAGALAKAEAVAHRTNHRSNSDLSAVALAKAEAVANRKSRRSNSEAVAHRTNHRSSTDLSAVALAKAEAVANRKNHRSSSEAVSNRKNHHALAAALGCLIALNLTNDAGAAEVTNVSTPSGSTHGSLVSGNIPCAIAVNEIGDCGKAAPAGAIVGTSDVQTLTNKTIAGAQNTLVNIPDSALSTNVDFLNAAQSQSGLKTFSGGLALPTGGNPPGSNFYEDANGNLHFVSPYMDAQIVGGKFAGDTSRPWFLSSTGSGITETSSGQQPNWTFDRNEYYNNGSGLSFNTTAQTNIGKGWNVATTNDFASGTIGITVTPNPNIAVGQNVNGSCVAAGTTVSSYSSGNVGLSAGLTCNLPNGSTVTFTPAANNAPGNAHNVGQYTLNSYTTGATGSGVALGSYAFGFGTGSSQILFGANVLARDLSGRKSSVSRSGLLAAEFDLVASGPDDGVNRILQDWVFAENGPSADGPTTFSAGARCRPSAANAQNTPNGVEIGYCFGATTMTAQPNGGNGQYGKIDKPFWADSCAISCFEIDGGSLTFQTSASASSGQPNLVFALGTNINPGQLVSGTNIPVGATVSAVYQCELSQPLSGCGGATNETLVVLSTNLTASVANNAPITFQAVIPDGGVWSANFSKEFVNWTNTEGPGKIKAGTAGNLGTVLTLTG